MMNRVLTPLVSAVCFLLIACSQPAPPAPKKVRTPVYVGKVEQKYPGYNYVLIALAGRIYEPGTVLISQSSGIEEGRRVANLIVTNERMGRKCIPADIRSGEVEPGDLVFLYRNLASPNSSVTIEPDAPEEPTESPQIIPSGSGQTTAGLLPLPGEPAEPEPAEQKRLNQEREKILKELENVPDRMEDPMSEFNQVKKEH